jgi:hypothetical protein
MPQADGHDLIAVQPRLDRQLGADEMHGPEGPQRKSLWTKDERRIESAIPLSAMKSSACPSGTGLGPNLQKAWNRATFAVS